MNNKESCQCRPKERKRVKRNGIRKEVPIRETVEKSQTNAKMEECGGKREKIKRNR